MRLVRVAAAVLAGAAVLTGCSDRGTANETLPSTSVIPSENTASLPPLGPPDLPMPAEARKQTAAGATAFIRYYVDLMNYAQRESMSQFVRDLSNACVTCSTFADGIDNYASQSYRYDGGAITLGGLSEPLMGDTTAEFSVSLTQDALEVLGPNELPVSGLESEKTTYPASGAAVTWDSERSTWVMTTLTIA